MNIFSFLSEIILGTFLRLYITFPTQELKIRQKNVKLQDFQRTKEHG